MPGVPHGNRGFRIDGRDVWLVSGSVHYCRIPAGLWEDRLTKAKWAGLNAVETPVPWNFHETKPGEWDFKRDRDLERFLKIAADLGLYVVLRVGPYVGADWEFGGIPADLGCDPKIALRENNPKFIARVEKWFSKLLPIVRKMQMTARGSVLMVQSEHEYFYPERPGGSEYLKKLAALLKSHRIEVPIVGCNNFYVDSRTTFEGWSDGEDPEVGLQRLAREQPKAPRIILHLAPGAYDRWGADRVGVRTPREAAARALRVVAEGGMFNWSPFAGGTNLEFWAGRAPRDDAGFLTTSYDCDAPIGEAGGLTRKYFALKTVNQFAACFGPLLGASEPARLKTELPAGFLANARKTDDGTILVVARQDGVADRWADVNLPGGVSLPLDFTHYDALPLLVDFKIGKKIHVDYGNCPVLAAWQERFVFFHGPAGSPAVVSVNGKLYEFKIPSGLVVEGQKVGDGWVFLLSSEAAETVWFEPNRVIIGAARPDDRPGKCIEAFPGEGIYVLEKNGDLKKCAGLRPPPARPPRKVGNWKRLSDMPEIKGEGTGWRLIDAPAEAAVLGVPRGYVWYRTKQMLDRKRQLSLFAPGGEDRIQFWVNGRKLTMFGRGAGATREPIPIDIEPGPCVITALVDNLGRFSRLTPLSDRKGLFDHLYSANTLHLSQPIQRPINTLPREVKPVWTLERKLAPDAKRAALFEMHFSQPQGKQIQVECRQLPEPCWIYVNDVFAGFFHGQAQAGFTTLLVNSPKDTVNYLRVYFASTHQRNVAERFRVYDLAENLTDGRCQWAYKPWVPPEVKNARWSRELSDEQTVRWYGAEFPAVEAGEPVFLKVDGLGKGQFFLNGHNLGRYWSVGPQTRFYLPEPYLEKTNELLFFEEQGKAPKDVALEFEPFGPFGDVHAEEEPVVVPEKPRPAAPPVPTPVPTPTL